MCWPIWLNPVELTGIRRSGDCVVFIYPPDDELLTKAADKGKALSYPELAVLYQRALAGDASAAVALTSCRKVSRDELRLWLKRMASLKASCLSGIRSTQVTPPMTADQRLDAELSRMAATSDNPAEREYARNALAERRLV